MIVVLHDKQFDGGVWGDFPPIPWIMTFVVRLVF
jgi:hypothetical protein